MAMNYDVLFQPIKIGTLTIKNRFVMPAMESGTTTPEHTFSDASIGYFTARARGGFGLIIADYMAISEDGIGVKTEAGLWDDRFINEHRRLTDAVHAENGKIFAQLHHSGMMCVKETTGVEPKGPSAIASPNYMEPVTEYTTEEVYGFIEKYAQAARRAKLAGFDGVEVHGAHGYQIAQFLSKFSNKRVDEFGGSYENRFRFAAMIIRRVKVLCGTDFPVLFRISADEYMDAGCTPHDAYLYASMAEAAGADAIHVSTGTGIGGNVVTPQYFEPGFNVDHAERIKHYVKVPVITVGRINDPFLVWQIVKTGRADMVSLGRQSICDPEFPNKVYEGRTEEIFRCTGCMQRCYYAKGCEESDTGVSCVVNPFSGKETRWKIEEAKKKKKILIAGAGPAGLEAAWILAKRGHDVTVFEKNDTPGGNYRLAAVPPKKQDLGSTIATYMVLCRKYGAKVRMNTEVTEEFLAEENPDVVILATGAVPLTPPIPGLAEHAPVPATEILQGKTLISGENILIIGGGLVGCETAEFLHIYHNRMTIVDMQDALAKEAVKRSRAVLMQRLEAAGTKAYVSTKVLEIFPDGIRAEKDGKELSLRGFDRVVMALGFRAYNPLQEAAEKYAGEVYAVGDAKRARDAKLAIYEAAKLAVEI